MPDSMVSGSVVGRGGGGGGQQQQRVRPGKLDSLPDYSISFEEGSESVEEGSQEGSESTHTHTQTHTLVFGTLVVAFTMAMNELWQLRLVGSTSAPEEVSQG